MTNQSHFLGQIQDEEKKAEDMLKKTELDNNKRASDAEGKAAEIIVAAEEGAREQARGRLSAAREDGKKEYKKIMENEDGNRHQIIEGGKKNVDNAKKEVKGSFLVLFK